MKQDIKEFFKKEYNADKNFQKVLSNIKNETEEKMNQNKLFKMVATFVIAIGITAGVVYAGSVVYENVFKAPEKIENYIEKIEINEEDLKNIITEEEAKREAVEGIKRFGIEISEEDITDVFLDKAVPNVYSLLYTITVLDGEMYIDGELAESVNLPAKTNARRNELFWKYQLPKGKHSVTFKWQNPEANAVIQLTGALVYSDIKGLACGAAHT